MSSVPYQAIFSLLPYYLLRVVLNYVMPEAVFVMITSISTFLLHFHLGYHGYRHLNIAKNSELAAKSKFKMPLYPVMNYLILAFFAFVLIILALNDDTRFALFFPPVWFIILGPSTHAQYRRRRYT